MGDLFFDDFEDKAYTDHMILADLEALVKSGQREGSVLDYKSDLSELDNWPQTVAAFANSFGGLIVFGVEGKNDQRAFSRAVSGLSSMYGTAGGRALPTGTMRSWSSWFPPYRKER